MLASNVRRLVIACVMISGCIGGIAPAVPVLDQESPYTNAGFAAGDARLLWQQEVVVGMIGQLSRIELYAACAGTTPLTINAGSLWQSDASEFFTLFTAVGEGWVAIDTTSAGLFFNAGDTFVIGVGGADSGLSLGGSNSEPQGGYPAGDIEYSWQSEYYDGPWDLAFRTYVDSENSSRVPAPAGILLIALGTGLVGWLRKRRSL